MNSEQVSHIILAVISVIAMIAATVLGVIWFGWKLLIVLFFWTLANNLADRVNKIYGN